MYGVSVDNDFARFGTKSYAINKITSVEVRQRKPHAAGCAAGLAGGAAILFMLWVTSLSDQPGGLIGLLIFSAILTGLAYWQWKRAQLVEYQLFLITSASETQAFTTGDESEVAALREQIEGAMTQASRGSQN